jgi:hypothetical protein
MGGWGYGGGSLGGQTFSANTLSQRYALDVEHQDLLDAIEDLAPEAQFVLLVFIANHLREAVDQGRLGLAVLN